MSVPPRLPEPIPEVLHLGCGRVKHPGSLGVDATVDSAADLVWDLDRRPWPLPDDHFRRIYLVNVLEHLADVVATMEEVHRVAAPDAEVRILAPAPAGHHLWTDPTHRRAFLSRSFQYFDPDFVARAFSYSSVRFATLEATFDPVGSWPEDERWMWAYRPPWYDRLILRWVNRHQDLYERRFLYWYPTRNVFFRLRVLKDGRRGTP